MRHDRVFRFWNTPTHRYIALFHKINEYDELSQSAIGIHNIQQWISFGQTSFLILNVQIMHGTSENNRPHFTHRSIFLSIACMQTAEYCPNLTRMFIEEVATRTNLSYSNRCFYCVLMVEYRLWTIVFLPTLLTSSASARCCTPLSPIWLLVSPSCNSVYAKEWRRRELYSILNYTFYFKALFSQWKKTTISAYSSAQPNFQNRFSVVPRKLSSALTNLVKTIKFVRSWRCSRLASHQK
jgi:hypothetical protein